VQQTSLMTSLLPFMYALPKLLSPNNCLLESSMHIVQTDFFHAHTHLSFIRGILTCLWHNMAKQTPTNGWNNCRGSHDTTKVNTILTKLRLTLSSLKYMMTLLIKLNSTSKTFICFTRLAPKISSASKNSIIMWQGTQL
jgi:hypothetical protein